MRKILYGTISLVFITVFLSGPAFFVSADCPDCYKDHTPPAGNISVKIHSSWSDNSGATNTNIWNAVNGFHSGGVNINGALESWNSARNGEPMTGEQGITQNLTLDQGKSNRTFGPNTATILIKQGEVKGGCAEIDMNGPPYVITLPPRIANMPADWIAATIKHEIGHVLGLEDGAGSCNGSIMNGCKQSGESQTKEISFNDVDKARQASDPNTRANCKAKTTDPDPAPQGYVDPTPIFYYPPVCFYFYDAIDHYDVETGAYRYTDYYLVDIICF